jgi:hypothetical protein
MNQEAKRCALKSQQETNFEYQRNQKQNIQSARFSMYLVKNQHVKNVKKLLTDEKMRYAEEQSIKNASIMNQRMQIKT